MPRRGAVYGTKIGGDGTGTQSYIVYYMYCIDAFRTCINDPVFSGVVLVCILVVLRQELRSKLAFMISHALGTLKLH